MTSPCIGLIGFGTIGRDLSARLRRHGYRIVVLLRGGSASSADVPDDAKVVRSVWDLIAVCPDLVVEAAGQTALSETVPELLLAGVTVIVASTGALGQADLAARLLAAAEAGGSRLIVPAGAIGGLDYLAALRDTRDVKIRYTSRKPAEAWTGELAALGYDASQLREPITLFEGTAADAARLYPRNLNAGLTVALAGHGADIVVHVVADPQASLNTHEIFVESALGIASMSFANRPSPQNPKTSALTAASLAAAVMRYFASIVI